MIMSFCRLSVNCDNDDGRDDEVMFQFTADKLLSTNGEVCGYRSLVSYV